MSAKVPLNSQFLTLIAIALALIHASPAQQAVLLRSTSGMGTNVQMGWAVGSLGDVDGDGTSDYAVSTRGPLLPSTANGFDVISGATGNTITSLPNAGTTAMGLSLFGSVLRAIGDVDGDGGPDILEGALSWNLSNSSSAGTGAIRIYQGYSGQLLFNLVGPFGTDTEIALRAVGDLDGDGTDDFAHSLRSGAPSIVLRSGANASVLATIPSPRPVVDLLQVSDLDGDGAQDFIVSTRGMTFYTFNYQPLAAITSTGTLLWNAPMVSGITTFGPQPIARVPDMSGDGIDDIAMVARGSFGVRLAVHDLTNGSLVNSVDFSAIYSNLPRIGISRLSDVNGDGIDDIALSSNILTGAVRILSGVDLSLLHGVTNVMGSPAPTTQGGTVTAISDLTGDGIPELLVGAPHVHPGGVVNAGQAIVFSLGPALTTPCSETQLTDMTGAPFSPLRINGNDGGLLHAVHAPRGAPLSIDLAVSPYAAGPAPFALWGTVGIPTTLDTFPTPLGFLCFKPASLFPLSPVLFTLANTFATDPTALLQAFPGPFSITVQPPLDLVFQLTFQGIQQHGPFVARTNAVILDVR